MASVKRTLQYHLQVDQETLWKLFVELEERLRATTRGSQTALGFAGTVWTKDQRLGAITSARTFVESRAQLAELGAEVTYSFYTLDAPDGAHVGVFGYLERTWIMVTVRASSLVTLEGLCAEVDRYFAASAPAVAEVLTTGTVGVESAPLPTTAIVVDPPRLSWWHRIRAGVRRRSKMIGWAIGVATTLGTGWVLIVWERAYQG